LEQRIEHWSQHEDLLVIVVRGDGNEEGLAIAIGPEAQVRGVAFVQLHSDARRDNMLIQIDLQVNLYEVNSGHLEVSLVKPEMDDPFVLVLQDDHQSVVGEGMEPGAPIELDLMLRLVYCVLDRQRLDGRIC